MSYQVIARKWRPQSFEEVTGQEPITRTLRNAVEHERLHHAYLFSGARGVGKTTTARLLAKALNCHKSNKPTPTPCAVSDPTACPSCREIAEGRSIDVQEIDAASATGVQNVRDSIIDTIGISPARDRYKVFIIDEVHMLSPAAFNALLKTLEEPPPRVVFIMATTESHKLPDTILSRCQQFEFRTIAAARIAERLRFIAAEEKIKVADDALREIARAGEGSMRDAQSAFDQVISFAGAEIKAEDVEAALGIAGSEMLARVMNGIALARPADALAVVDDLVMRGHDLRNFCRDLLAHLRDLLVAKVSGEKDGFLDSSSADRKELRRQAASFTESDLIRFFHSLTETENSLRTAAHPRYQLEVGLVKLMEMRRLAPLQQLIERLDALEEASRTGKAPAPRTPPTGAGGSNSLETGSKSSKTSQPPRGSRAVEISRDADAPESASFAPDEPPFDGVGGTGATAVAPALTLVPPVSPPPLNEEVVTAFTAPPPTPPASAAPPASQSASAPAASGSPVAQIKAALEKRRRMFLVTALDAAHRASVEGNELCVEFAPEAKHLRDTLAKPESVKILREVCRELLGHDIGVRISIKERGATGDDMPLSKDDEARRDKQQLREMAEQHPAVQQILQTFHGEIVDVRRVEQKPPAANPKPE
ncbi:MAG TPA: DNA polymerase III subunit gamma/tau [Pyrinomonadaceae bacterium]|jgi:DNA polymerase-3 subunit gamma/tau